MANTNTLNAEVAKQQNLVNAVVLVTGSSRGIGKAIALKLASLGAAVGICGRDAEALTGTKRELEALGAAVHSQTTDVTKAGEVAALVDATEKNLGPISVLVNNAGIGLFGPIQERTEEEWDRTLNTNLKSVFLASKAVAPLMIQRRKGDIINIGSLAGKNTFSGGAIYCASKWGLQGLTGCMAEDLRGFGIRVSVICPGSVGTEFSGHKPKDPSKILTPADVAHAVAMVLLQGPQSFISEVHLRPVAKP
jgi:NADP-dependent 3-hydroxy acid dehydrogenase YdfG